MKGGAYNYRNDCTSPDLDLNRLGNLNHVTSDVIFRSPGDWLQNIPDHLKLAWWKSLFTWQQKKSDKKTSVKGNTSAAVTPVLETNQSDERLRCRNQMSAFTEWTRADSIRYYRWKLVPGWRVEHWMAEQDRTAGEASSHLVPERCSLIGQVEGLLSLWLTQAGLTGGWTFLRAATGWAECLGGPVGPDHGGCSSRALLGPEGEPLC